MEVHDHRCVGDKLKMAAGHAGVTVSSDQNATFSGRLARLKTLAGPAFYKAYMEAAADIHARDGAAFAKEVQAGGSPDLRAFVAGTHRIVLRQVGAIKAIPSGR